METRASYVAVGSFVLIVVLSFLVFAVWLGRLSIDQISARYLIYFSGSVNGLQVGSPVRYRGIPVGQVEDIRIDPFDVGRVRVVVELRDDTPIVEGNVARLELQGITGGVFIEIRGGEEGQPPLVADAGADYPVIPSQASSLQAVLDSVPELVISTTKLIDSASAFLSEENQQAVSDSLANVQALTGVLATEAENVAGALERIDALVVNLDGLVSETRVDTARLSDRLDGTLETVDGAVGELSGEVAAAVRQVRQVAGSFSETAGTLNGLLTDVRPGVQNFAEEGLYEFTLMVAELRGLARSMGRVAERLERAPAQFIFGDSDTGVTVD